MVWGKLRDNGQMVVGPCEDPPRCMWRAMLETTVTRKEGQQRWPLSSWGTLKLWYDIHGHGPRVVFIPGTASDLRQQLNIFASPLIEHFEVLSFDPRGIGQANSPDAAPTMIGERVADLVREPLRLAACLFPQGALCNTVASHRQPAGREAR
jgi:hypothetical protein